MTTNKIPKVSEVEREVLRLLATEVDENGSASDQTVARALALADVPRRGAVLNGLARKGLVEVCKARECVVLTPAGAAVADEAARAHATKMQHAQVAGEIVRFLETLRDTIAAGDATAAGLCARALPATSERFHIGKPDADQLWVDVAPQGEVREDRIALSANDAIRDDARGAATRAAAAVFEYVARPRSDFPTQGVWFYLPEERAGVARIAKAVTTTQEDAREIRAKLHADFGEGGTATEYALRWDAKGAVVHGQLAAALAPIGKAAADSPENLGAVREVVAAVRAEAERELTRHRPWNHNSTCPMSNLLNLWRADALAEVVGTCDRLLW